jgi:hypothetical protein
VARKSSQQHIVLHTLAFISQFWVSIGLMLALMELPRFSKASASAFSGATQDSDGEGTTSIAQHAQHVKGTCPVQVSGPKNEKHQLTRPVRKDLEHQPTGNGRHHKPHQSNRKRTCRCNGIKNLLPNLHRRSGYRYRSQSEMYINGFVLVRSFHQLKEPGFAG